MRKALMVVGAIVLAMALAGCAPKGVATDADIGAWGAVDGMTVERAKADVAGTENDAVYLTERYELSAYRIQVPNGSYVVCLHFAETYERIDAAGQRVFTVSIEGKPVLEDFDPFKEAGGKAFTAIVKEFRADVADGELTIEFKDKVQNTMINGICVAVKKGGLFGGTQPILRINCGSAQDTTCPKGCTWKKDQVFVAK